MHCSGSKVAQFFHLLVIAGITSSIHAQKPAADVPQSSPVVRVQTTLITIPAVVTDKLGNPVTNLTKEDFVVKENGWPQTIAVFEHVKTTDAPILRTVTPDGSFSNRFNQDEPARLTIIVLDAVSTGITERLEVRKQVTSFIAKNVSVNQPVALLVIVPTGLKVLHDFTTDPKVLVSALQKVSSGKSAQESIAMDEEVLRGRSGPRKSNADSFDQLVARESGNIESAFQAFLLMQKKRLVVNSLEAFHDIAEAFSGIPGRKSLIWISNGLSISLGDAETSSKIGPQLTPYFERTWRALNASNIAVYPLDVSDLVNTGYSHPAFGMSRGRAAPVASVYNMEHFADQTGGRMCYRREDLDSCFKKASHDSEDYYMLGYYPDASREKPGWRKLEVFIPTKQVKIRARSGYYPQTTRPDQDRMIASDLITAMGSPLEFTTFPLDVKLKGVAGIQGEKTKKRVNFTFFVPPSAKFIGDEDNTINVEFAALAKLPDAKPAGEFVRQAAGSLRPEVAADVKLRGIVMDGSIDLPPGEYQVKFVVRDNLTGRLGSVTAPAKVDTGEE